MNKVAVGAAALVVVAGGGLGFAAWSGGKVTSELQSQTAALLAPFPGLKLVENSVSKGLFSSTHTVTIEAGCGLADAAEAATDGSPAKPVQITWRNHVRHGPLPGGRGVGLATIDTEIVLPPTVAAQLTRIYGDQPVVTVHTALGFGGAYVTDVASPPFKHAEAGKGDIDWQGLKATVRGSLTGGMAAGGSYTFEAPGLNFNFTPQGQPPRALRVGRMTMQGDVTPQPNASLLFAPGRSHGAVDTIVLAITSEAGGKAMDVRFENLKFNSDAKSDGQGLWSAVGKLGMKGSVGDFPIEQIDMQVSLNRLHGATYEQLVRRAMQSPVFTCHKPAGEAAMREADALSADMQKSLAALLAHNPEYALDHLTVRLGGKVAELSYRVGTKGVTAADAALPLPAMLATKAYGSAGVKVENGWLEQVVKKAVSIKADATGAAADEAMAQTMAMINSVLDGVVAQGYLAREGDALVSKAEFGGGMLNVNGKPLNMPQGLMGK